jgi:uncharacterized membrane protein
MRRRLPIRPSTALASFWIGAGVLHFVIPKQYEAIVPEWLPAHRELVVASGIAEIAGGLAALDSRTRRGARWWLLSTLLAVFPANVNMAARAERYRAIPEPLLWARLPIQGAILFWIWRVAIRGRSA